MLLFLLISTIYLINFEASIWIWLTFLMNATLLALITYYHVFLEKEFSPFLSTFIVFNYIFFFAAPISQINKMLSTEKPTFLNNFPLKEPLIIKTALFVFLFNLIFFLSYDYLKKKHFNKLQLSKSLALPSNLPTAILIMTLLCIIIVFVNIDFIVYEYSRPEWMESSVSKSTALIKTKLLFIFPLGVIIACRAYLIKQNKNKSNAYIVLGCLLVTTILLFFVKNPFITKRHDLGAIMFLLLFLFLPKLVNSNTRFLNILFFAVIIGLPLSQLITHSDYGINELISKPSRLLDQVNQGVLTDGYVSLNYDAFMNIGTVIEAVQQNGFSYGYQLLSALLFFVPRSIWEAKPDASGTVVGKHLTENYEFFFQNVSNPFISESYHNFGIFGIITFAIVLAVVCIHMLKLLRSDSLFKRAIAFYFSLHLIFILRGDFTSSFAYMIATIIGIYLLPVAIIRLTNYKVIYIKKQ